ncbi:MAG: hypothetical protein WAM84_04970 [Candidatus Cybelea sp.]
MSFTCLPMQQRFAAAIVVALALPAISACAGSSLASAPLPSGASAAHARIIEASGSGYTFQTVNDPADPTTEVLGINNLNKLCGYYGDPNVGFVTRNSYANFTKEVFPGAQDTVVTSINNQHTIAGWYTAAKLGTKGFTEWNGIWTNYKDNHERNIGANQVTKLLGLSDGGLAVGYYVDGGVDHAILLYLATGKFKDIDPPGATSSEATGINGKGDIVGWLTLASGVTEGWLLKGGQFTLFQYPAALETQPTALDWTDDIVGSYEDASSNTHGFVLNNPLTSQVWTEIDDPSASGGETVVASINNHHTLAGYYQAPSGSINGFVATSGRSGN